MLRCNCPFFIALFFFDLSYFISYLSVEAFVCLFKSVTRIKQE